MIVTVHRTATKFPYLGKPRLSSRCPEPANAYQKGDVEEAINGGKGRLLRRWSCCVCD